jgi:predicted dehydrogenase
MPRWGAQGWFAQTRLSGHAALDLHIHDADTIQWFFGRPEKVLSCGRRSADGGVEYIWTNYQCPGGAATIMSEGGWYRGDFPFAMGATLVFESAAVDYRSSRKETLWVHPDKGRPRVQRVPSAEGYREELAYFVRCVAAGRAPRRATPEDAASAVEVVEAEVRSVRTGRAVTVR